MRSCTFGLTDIQPSTQPQDTSALTDVARTYVHSNQGSRHLKFIQGSMMQALLLMRPKISVARADAEDINHLLICWDWVGAVDGGLDAAGSACIPMGIRIMVTVTQKHGGQKHRAKYLGSAGKHQGPIEGAGIGSPAKISCSDTQTQSQANACTGRIALENDDPENVPESNGPPSSSSSAVALQFQQDADNDDNEEYTSGLGQVVEVEDDISGSSRRRQIRCFFGQMRMFRIHNMFNWSVEVGWDEFWFQDVKNME
ncbi:hypothetical protein F4604DRAFT_1906687 [Suillus subluteus]|nr:hypothetical protein F4604DRAFT_1906687 [Suillus subluteus]